MSFSGDCPKCNKSMGADREVRSRGWCDKCEIERLEGIIANYFSSGDAAELHDEFVRICVKGEGP